MYELRKYLPVSTFGELIDYLSGNPWAWSSPYETALARALLERVYGDLDPSTPIRAAYFVRAPRISGPGVKTYYILRIWGLPSPRKRESVRGVVDRLFGGGGVMLSESLTCDPINPSIDVYYTKP